MTQYIDKSAVVAEIERRIKEIDEIGICLSPKGLLTNLLCHLNALEVKEVDLEIEEERKLHLTDLLDAYQKGKWKAVAAQMDEMGNQLADKIFELGDKFHWGFGPGIEEHQPHLTNLDILKCQREVLNDLLPKYTGKTLDNVLVNIEARIKEEEK